MKRFILLAMFLTACQSGTEDAAVPPENKATEFEAKADVKTGVVRLRLNDPVSEPRACIIPIAVENGLPESTRVVMIAFELMGPGDDAKGNMFAPAAAPGEISEARVVVEGQSCAAFDTIRIPEMRCTSGQEDCESKVELIDGSRLRFSRTG